MILIRCRDTHRPENFNPGQIESFYTNKKRNEKVTFYSFTFSFLVSYFSVFNFSATIPRWRRRRRHHRRQIRRIRHRHRRRHRRTSLHHRSSP